MKPEKQQILKLKKSKNNIPKNEFDNDYIHSTNC